MPIQVLESNKKPSFGQRFSNAVGAGLQGGNQLMQHHQQQKMQQQAVQTAKEKLGIDITGFDPDTQKALLVEAFKQQGKGNRDVQKQDFVNKLFGGGQNQQRNVGQELQGGSESPEEMPSQMPQGFDTANISDEDIIKANAIDPSLGNALTKLKDTATREQTAKTTAKEKKAAELRKERAPHINKIIEQADLSRESIRNKNHLLNIIEKGDLDDPTYAVFASALPFNLGKRLLSNDTVEYKGALVDEFSDLKNVFKGATRVKEVEIYEDKLPDIYLTDDQKKTILKSRINTSKVDILREEAAQEAEENFPNLTALQFNKKVDELMQPKMNALFNQVWDQQKAIINEAENRKEIPLDITDPDDKKIMQQIFDEAKGDKAKALKLAQKKGYKFK